jgi:hypothetical protein
LRLHNEMMNSLLPAGITDDRPGVRRAAVALIVAVLAGVVPGVVHAQLVPRLPVALEVRAGGALPTGEFAEASPGVGAEAGPVLEASAIVRVIPAIGIYVGYRRAWFSCSLCAERGMDDSVVDSGLEFGVEGDIPLEAAGGVPWIRVGGILHQLAFSGFGSTLSSDPGLGLRVGAGFSVPLTAPLLLVPAVSYAVYPAELGLGGLPDRTVNAGRLAADLGIRFTF